VKPNEADVRAFVFDQLAARFDEAGITAEDVRDETDLLAGGIVDSLGVLELIAMVSDRFGVEDEWDDYDPDQLLVVGPFCRYVAEKAAANA
jgi:acyl carrier protein